MDMSELSPEQLKALAKYDNHWQESAEKYADEFATTNAAYDSLDKQMTTAHIEGQKEAEARLLPLLEDVRWVVARNQWCPKCNDGPGETPCYACRLASTINRIRGEA